MFMPRINLYQADREAKARVAAAERILRVAKFMARLDYALRGPRGLYVLRATTSRLITRGQ